MVGARGNQVQFALTGGAAVNGVRTVADVGLSSQLSTSATVRLDPLYAGGATSLAKASSASGTAGTGGVPSDYTLASGSPCKAAVPSGVLPFDWSGNARSATSDTAGAWA